MTGGSEGTGTTEWGRLVDFIKKAFISRKSFVVIDTDDLTATFDVIKEGKDVEDILDLVDGIAGKDGWNLKNAYPVCGDITHYVLVFVKSNSTPRE